MQTISQILTYPNGTPIEAVQVKLDKVWEYKTMTGAHGPYTVQNVTLSDVTGQKIRAGVFGHHDLKSNEGKELVLHATSGKGIEVEHAVWGTPPVNHIQLKVGKQAVWQYVEVYKQNNPSAATSPVAQTTAQAAPIPANSSPVYHAQGQVNGAKVGMAINCATALLVASADAQGGFPSKSEIVKKIDWLASELIKLSTRLESGSLYVDEQVSPPAVAPKPSVQNQTESLNDQDVPF